MALPHPYLLPFIFTLVSFIVIMVQGSSLPSSGFSPSSRFQSIGFNQGFRYLWGPNNMNIDQTSLSIWLDKNSGSGFKSHNMYRSGYFGAFMKLHPGYTAGVITSLYLSNNQDFPGHHDEIDIEFLGTTSGRPYTLQTNVYIRGSGDGSIVGREMQFHLWFDPTQDFHNYAILWSPNEIIFFVNDVPIRRYPRKVNSTYPQRPMYLYSSIWDASSWATEDGKYKADYKYQPFVGRYKNFKMSNCTTNGPSSCHAPFVSPSGTSGLSRQQVLAMQWVQKNHMVYNYCSDPKRDHSQLPEC